MQLARTGLSQHFFETSPRGIAGKILHCGLPRLGHLALILPSVLERHRSQAHAEHAPAAPRHLGHAHEAGLLKHPPADFLSRLFGQRAPFHLLTSLGLTFAPDMPLRYERLSPARYSPGVMP
jgi:hypothetical protein